jgi:hypothetical protein
MNSTTHRNMLNCRSDNPRQTLSKMTQNKDQKSLLLAYSSSHDQSSLQVHRASCRRWSSGPWSCAGFAPLSMWERRRKHPVAFHPFDMPWQPEAISVSLCVPAWNQDCKNSVSWLCAIMNKSMWLNLCKRVPTQVFCITYRHIHGALW